MFGLRLLLHSAFALLSYAGPGTNGDIMPPMVGGQRDSNDCLIGAGFTWCEANQECIRRWETPCADNFSDCSDCLKRQRNGENIACPVQCDNETPTCETNEDCGDSRFCRPTTMNVDGPKECVLYSKDGDSCGGYTLPSYESRCHPSLECANTMGPMIADAPGQCRRVRGGPVLTDGTVLDAGFTSGDGCEQCPPPVPCPAPGPNCEYSRPLPDKCGCTVGCGQMNCYVVDPLPQVPRPPPSVPPPAPPTPVCPEVMCMMYCENGWQIDENGCNLCACNTVSSDIDKNQVCPIPYENCFDEYVCPKVTEVTTCGEGGIHGYTTYQLSLVINPGLGIRNVYALFGDKYNNLGGEHPMIIPGAYQVSNIFGTNLGGVPGSTTQFSKNSMYDSWLTIGITDGDIDSKLGAIGIDFESWNLDTSLIIENGAVFLLDPNENNIVGNEMIVGQLTLPNERNERMILNAQGKLHNSPETWKQYNIVFQITSPVRNDNPIPLNCISWYDGCNTCRVNNGVIGACTRMMCFQEEEPYCISSSSGH